MMQIVNLPYLFKPVSDIYYSDWKLVKYQYFYKMLLGFCYIFNGFFLNIALSYINAEECPVVLN